MGNGRTASIGHPGRAGLQDFEAGFREQAGRLATQVVTSAQGLQDLAEEWNALFQRCAGAASCGLHDWSLAWIGAFVEGTQGVPGGASPFVVVVRDPDGVAVGAFPLFERRASGGSLLPRSLWSVGSAGRVGVHGMTEGSTALVAPGWEREAVEALVARLREGLDEGRWDRIDVRLPDASAPGSVAEAFRTLEDRYRVVAGHREARRVASLPATWGEYRRSLTKSMRDNLGYYPRLLTRDGHDWTVRIVREPGEMRAAAGRLADLHRARYDQLRGPSHTDHIHSPAHREFLATLMERLAHEGRALVGELVVDGAVVASQAFVEAGGTLTVYYSGALEAWHRYSPVFVVDAAVFQEAQARGVRRVDFMDARKAWVDRWGARPEPPDAFLRVTSRRPASRVRLALEAARAAWAAEVRERGRRIGRRLQRGLRRALGG